MPRHRGKGSTQDDISQRLSEGEKERLAMRKETCLSCSHGTLIQWDLIQAIGINATHCGI